MKWRPIETAPHGELLTWVKPPGRQGFYALCRMDEDDVWHNDGGDPMVGSVAPTHWMPLPAPPMDEAAG